MEQISATAIFKEVAIQNNLPQEGLRKINRWIWIYEHQNKLAFERTSVGGQGGRKEILAPASIKEDLIKFAKERVEGFGKRSRKKPSKKAPVAVPVVAMPVVEHEALINRLSDNIQKLRAFGYEVKCRYTAPFKEL